MLALPLAYKRNLTYLRALGLLTTALVASLYWRSGVLQMLCDWVLHSLQFEAGLDSTTL